MKSLDDLHLLVRLLKEFELPISPILEFAINELEENLKADVSQTINREVCGVISNNNDKNHSFIEKSIPKRIYTESQGGNKNAKLIVYRSDNSIIQDDKVANIFAQTIKEIGPKEVKELNITSDGMNLVTIGGNPLYPSAQKDVGGGYYVNTHSGTMWKKKILERIFDSLHLSWKVTICYE